ncbi:hypothetical protein MSG28_008978 [Choristoneura fumiferana]|uniref:Uncharacterized protein n=1 Tax=Choristoneura fumiferana TaxID=7141 RepID=A0ACC0J8T9_CHOFU|nr:hypothetical protein MSG28_008978 [Choristoneura fumiferana]
MVMFFVMTLGRRMGDGPFWKPIIETEAEDCYHAWWRHLLYIQNYFDNNQCMAHAWYLAADFQLSILGIIIAYVLNGARAQKMAIGALFAVGLLTPAVQVFMQNLHAILIVSPEMALNFFVNDDTFNNLYKRGHTNLSCYALGLALAFLIYNLKESDIGSHKYKKFRLFYWMLFPIELFIVLTGAIFYIPGIQIPLGVRMVYSSSIKVLFGAMIFFHIFFTILKVDNTIILYYTLLETHRGILNWAGWGILAKFTYSTYIVHVCILRTYTADNDALSRTTFYKILMSYTSLLVLSFVLALTLWFIVEKPVANLVKTFIFPAPPKKVEKTKSVSMVADLASSKETVEVKI